MLNTSSQANGQNVAAHEAMWAFVPTVKRLLCWHHCVSAVPAVLQHEARWRRLATLHALACDDSQLWDVGTLLVTSSRGEA